MGDRPVPHQRGLGLAAQAPWHFLYFLPDPHQHGSLRPICSVSSTRRCCTTGAGSSSPAAGPSPPAPAAPAIAAAPRAAPLEYDTRALPVDDPLGEYCCAGSPPPLLL